MSVWNDRVLPLLRSVDMLRDEKTSNWQVKRRRFLRRKNIQHHYAVKSSSGTSTAKPFGHSYKELKTFLDHRGFESSLPIWAQRSIVREQVLSSSVEIEVLNDDVEVSNGDVDKVLNDHETKDEEIVTTTTNVDDKRQCVTCLKIGDRDAFCEGRLLLVPRSTSNVSEWIHVNCALWASECHEDKNGEIINVAKALSRGARLKCSLCSRSGATVGCCHPLCKETYHIECAIESGCFLNATVYCKKHRKDKEVDRFVLDGTLPRYLVCSEKKCGKARGKKERRSIISRLLRLDSLTIHRFGEISTDPRGGQFHDKNFIYPCGFVAARIHWCLDGSNRKSLYACRVERVQRKAVFIISDYYSNSQLKADTADKVVRIFYEKLYEARLRSNSSSSRAVSTPNFASSPHRGAYFMGFGLFQAAQHIERLDGAVQLALPKSMCPGIEAIVSSLSSVTKWPEYHFHTRHPSKEEILLAFKCDQALAKEFSERVTNASGCARCEPYRVNAKRHALSGLADDDDGATTTTMPKMILVSDNNSNEKKKKTRRNNSLSNTSIDYASKYLELKSIPWEERVCVRRSRIHGWGIFVRKSFKKDDMIVEFTGEIIRSVVADKREKMYEASGMIGCYMFRLNKEYIIDGTKKGNITRFTNHSCDPNAYVKVINVRQGSNEIPGPHNEKIVFFAKKNMPRGTELLYDYQYALEDDKEILCNCQAINCRGRMN